MSDPSYALQVGMAAALLADDGVAALIQTSVKDVLSAQKTPYPLIEFGEFHVTGESDGCNDNARVAVTIRVLANTPRGSLIAKQIGAACNAVLAPVTDGDEPPFDLVGFVIVSALFERAAYTFASDASDPIGLVAVGELTFVYQIAPAA